MSRSRFQTSENERQGAKEPRERQERQRQEPPLGLDELARRVIGMALEVHSQLGPGFLELVYEEALCIELGLCGVRFQRQLRLPVLYKGRFVAESRLDLLVEENLVVEVKAVESLRPVHLAQVFSYLRAGEFQLGLLLNFNEQHLRDGIRRVVWTG